MADDDGTEGFNPWERMQELVRNAVAEVVPGIVEEQMKEKEWRPVENSSQHSEEQTPSEKQDPPERSKQQQRTGFLSRAFGINPE